MRNYPREDVQNGHKCLYGPLARSSGPVHTPEFRCFVAESPFKAKSEPLKSSGFLDKRRRVWDDGEMRKEILFSHYMEGMAYLHALREWGGLRSEVEVRVWRRRGQEPGLKVVVDCDAVKTDSREFVEAYAQWRREIPETLECPWTGETYR